MTKPGTTRKTFSTWRKSWAVSLLASTLVLGLFGCTKSHEQPAEPVNDAEVSRLTNSWLGRYAARDEKIAGMLTDHEGWISFREMDLFGAIRFFSMEANEEGRLGAARSYLEMSRMFDALDRYFMEIEAVYLSSLGTGVSADKRGRLGFTQLRRGNANRARDIFFSNIPKGHDFVWKLGRAGVLYAEGNGVEAEKIIGEIKNPAVPEHRELLRVATFIWGAPVDPGDTSYYGDALDALTSGDFFGGVVSLQMLEMPEAGTQASADLYIYSLFRIVFAKMALDSTETIEAAEGNFIMGKALGLLGEYAKSTEAFGRVVNSAEEDTMGNDAVWLFGPVLDHRETGELATIYRGLAFLLDGKPDEAAALWKKVLDDKPGMLGLATLAAIQAGSNLGGPLGDPEQVVQSAIESTRVLRLKVLGEDQGKTMAALLLAREAEIGRQAALVARSRGKTGLALDLLDKSHQKKQGNRPSFINTPSFMVELSRAYKESGQYAPAVDILFVLSNQYPSTRLAYESLKRLYASKTGGEAPPR